MKSKSANITITGKIFVPEDAIGENLTLEEEKELFVNFAKGKVNEMFSTDELIRLNEIEIDLDSYRS